MKKLIFICLLVLSNVSHATVNNFIGAYNVSNWTQSPDGGMIDLTNAPSSISLTSSDAGDTSIWPRPSTNTDFTTTAASSGWVGFNWSYYTNDIDGPWFDPFGTVLNGVFTQLSVSNDPNVWPYIDNGNPGRSQSGVTQFWVGAGDVFGFRAFSTDATHGSAITTITNFYAPGTAPVPEPETYAMLLAGLGLLGFMARRRKNIAA